ncbi:phosphomannomutase [Cognatishimia sp.]|uniref:phosphomannomutase n=1 Tax=Cognatishimia sp. TaxID=2211648 RepID=UPI0035133D73
MAPKFGTSGLRGLVTELTADLVRSYTQAFIASCDTGGAVHVGQDLRPSSPEIAGHVIEAIRDAGLMAVDCGVLPTPALAYQSMAQGHAAIMVTGSHIPADRNGLKFYLPSGEISKADETAILSALGTELSGMEKGDLSQQDSATEFVARYTSAFAPDALAGLRIGVYQHSSVARDLLVTVLDAMGATVTELARSDKFIPVDTEAVDPATRDLLTGWVREHDLDAIVSTDGDADRPMLAIAPGEIVPGDVLGALTADYLGADVICTPVSSNTMIEAMSGFSTIHRTKIGSPFVIAAMEHVLAEDSTARVVGYEANGGFLLGFDAKGLSPLMTRDCILPILAPLALARSRGVQVADLVSALPPRFTAADRLQGIATEKSKAFLAEMRENTEARRAFFAGMPGEQSLDLTDGLRVTFAGGDVVHLRPSGNAPEFRCYAESDSAEAAVNLVNTHLSMLKARLG